MKFFMAQKLRLDVYKGCQFEFWCEKIEVIRFYFDLTGFFLPTQIKKI